MIIPVLPGLYTLRMKRKERKKGKKIRIDCFLVFFFFIACLVMESFFFSFPFFVAHLHDSPLSSMLICGMDGLVSVDRWNLISLQRTIYGVAGGGVGWESSDYA